VVYWSEFLATERGCIVLLVRYELNLYMLSRRSRLPLWSTGQSFWLQIQGPRFDFRRYQIFGEVVGMERGPLSLVSTTEELLGTKSNGSGLESREYGLWIRHADHVAPSIRKVWHLLRQQAAVAPPVEFARGLRPRNLVFSLIIGINCCITLEVMQYNEMLFVYQRE
jgi:hypothetical protein